MTSLISYILLKTNNMEGINPMNKDSQKIIADAGKLVDSIDRSKNEGKTTPNQVVMNTKELVAHQKFLGTDCKILSIHLIEQLGGVFSKGDGDNLMELVTRAVAVQNAIQPKDELEALLATQMVGVHNLAMKLMCVASVKGQYEEAISRNVESANKLLRTFAAQMEALNRHRGKGQQKVTVEHVTVNQGGQAVIGAVDLTPGGGANEKK